MAEITNSLISKIKKLEGGYVNNPNDKGGCTNSGITISTYRKYFGKTKTCNDLKKLSENHWMTIFINGYWNKILGYKIKNQSIADFLADWYWHSGSYAIKFTQQILNVSSDGVVGPKTIAAINNYPNQKELFQKLWNRRKKQFDDIVKRNPSQKIFLKGWYNRINNFKWFE
jgi:lysozyme family protein